VIWVGLAGKKVALGVDAAATKASSPKSNDMAEAATGTALGRTGFGTAGVAASMGAAEATNVAGRSREDLQEPLLRGPGVHCGVGGDAAGDDTGAAIASAASRL